MPRADTANFNRFLTSLGVLLVAVSLLAPYFYFHNTELLRIPRKELASLSAKDRRAIQGRKSAMIKLEGPVIGLAAALFVGGLTCLVAGGWRLWKLQGKEDAAIDRQAQLDNFRIKNQTEAEKQERLEEQALEMVEGPNGADRLDLQESRRAVGRTEARLDESFAQETLGSFHFLSDVTVLGEQPEDRLAIDGLFSALSVGLADVVLEQKLVVSDPAPRLAHYTNSILALLARYRYLTGRNAVGWLVLVVAKEADALSTEARENLQAQFDRELGGLGRATVLGEDELAVAPVHFRALFEPHEHQR